MPEDLNTVFLGGGGDKVIWMQCKCGLKNTLTIIKTVHMKNISTFSK